MAKRDGVALWVRGARVRTLPLAFAPVILGGASAWWAGAFDPWVWLGCLAVAVTLQVGVNYANDYSDGIRGTDEHRVGPARLTASGAVEARKVKAAALVSFAAAGVAGLAVVLATQSWWLLVVGAAAVIAAWFYTGGRRPYGYRGWGEVVAFVFFGLIATAGTAGAMIGDVPPEAWLTGAAVGSFASAVLLVNNLRDREQDQRAGKRTLAVMAGERTSRVLIVALLVAPYLIVAILSTLFIWAPAVFAVGILTAVVIVIVTTAKTPNDLVMALGLMSLNSLLFAIALSLAIAF